jgi:transcriptional regulator with PAS, ATPase and Fis domain
MPPELTPEAEGAIARFSWPGNVRQLHSEVMNLLVQASNGTIHLHHLSRAIREATRPRREGLRAQREDFERERVREALERHRGNRTAAAGELGLSRQGLAKVMRRLGLRPGGNGTSGMP